MTELSKKESSELIIINATLTDLKNKINGLLSRVEELEKPVPVEVKPVSNEITDRLDKLAHDIKRVAKKVRIGL